MLNNEIIANIHPLSAFPIDQSKYDQIVFIFESNSYLQIKLNLFCYQINSVSKLCCIHFIGGSLMSIRYLFIEWSYDQLNFLKV